MLKKRIERHSFKHKHASKHYRTAILNHLSSASCCANENGLPFITHPFFTSNISRLKIKDSKSWPSPGRIKHTDEITKWLSIRNRRTTFPIQRMHVWTRKQKTLQICLLCHSQIFLWHSRRISFYFFDENPVF